MHISCSKLSPLWKAQNYWYWSFSTTPVRCDQWSMRTFSRSLPPSPYKSLQYHSGYQLLDSFNPLLWFLKTQFCQWSLHMLPLKKKKKRKKKVASPLFQAPYCTYTAEPVLPFQSNSTALSAFACACLFCPFFYSSGPAMWETQRKPYIATYSLTHSKSFQCQTSGHVQL